jgi:murein DD-endopeptidase MepM/ murein hydrolase activator NlpD
VNRPLRLVVPGLAAACVLVGAASASPPVSPGPPATANGLAIQIVGPDQTTAAATTVVSAPPDAAVPAAAFAYPADGSVVAAQSSKVDTTASAPDGTASATTTVSGLSIFAGEITADTVQGSVSSAGTIGDLGDSTVSNLVALGAPVAVAANARIPLADWGYAIVLSESTAKGAASTPSWRGTVAGLVVHLNVDHGGLPAGSEIRIGYADAYARPPESPTTTSATRTSTAPQSTTTSTTRRATSAPPTPFAHGAARAGVTKSTTNKNPSKKRGAPPVLSPPTVTPKLTAGGYVFPIYGPSGYGDTFGAPRGDVSGGWHHGDDVFAPLGAPVLAVASGTVFSVGWNEVGGWRLWLRDSGGNEFYYAHLSAYTSLAVNGRHVNAGEVLGFVGNTGDAQGTPFHLHFEVHPVSMLFLGYDGAVNPTPYLNAWQRLEDIRILPAVPFSLQLSTTSSAPTPGAILLQASDISTASGLDPGSLRRAMRAPVTVPIGGGGGSIGELPTPLPVLDRA